jgi:streptomycin 6-kinase
MVERLEPGTPLSYLVGPDGAKDDETTLIAAEVMPQLWRPLEPGHPFQTVEYLAKGLGRLRQTFNGGAGPFPAHLVTAAEALYAELMPSQGPRVLLHGDLHHENILLGQHGWLAIDPQGFAGEAEYEVGALLRNPTPQVATWPDLPRRMARRLDLLSERLGFDRQRLWGWALAQAVLSLWWDYEDHGHNGAELPGGKIGLPIAEALYAIR